MKKIVNLSTVIGVISLSVVCLSLYAQPSEPLRTARLLSEAREPVRVVCFGDSITGIYYHSGNRRAWPEMLKIALNRLYPKADVTVVNAGISSQTTVHGLARMQKDVLDRKPHLVVIMFGMNDLAYGTVTPEQDAARKVSFAGNLKTMVGKCRDAGAEVILCTQNPVYPEASPARLPQRLGEFAEIICRMGAELKGPVTDIYAEWSALKSADPHAWRLLMSETIHPSMAGHKRMAEQVAETIAGRSVSLADVLPEQPVCNTLIARLRAGQPVTIAAPAQLVSPVRAMVLRRFPGTEVTIIPLGENSISLDASVKEHKELRTSKPHLAFVSLGPDLLTIDDDEHFIRQVSWVVNWSLPFGGSAWTAVGVDPALICPELTQPQQAGAVVLRQIVQGHDLDWIAAAPNAQDALDSWFDRQLPPLKVIP
ncbi:MAG: SGNH/GDSL hydrolase family protein [Kiritimatiellia bacterium]